MSDPNERMAVLLGWKFREGWDLLGRRDDYWAAPDGWSGVNPNFDTWDRFPEMQAYVRGLGWADVNAIEARASDVLDVAPSRVWLHIIPAILRDAILATVGDAAVEQMHGTTTE